MRSLPQNSTKNHCKLAMIQSEKINIINYSIYLQNLKSFLFLSFWLQNKIIFFIVEGQKRVLYVMHIVKPIFFVLHVKSTFWRTNITHCQWHLRLLSQSQRWHYNCFCVHNSFVLKVEVLACNI